MSLRSKILLVNAAVFATLLLALHAASSAVVFHGFGLLEEREARRNAERALTTLDAELAAMVRTARDWAAWEDTCQFVEDGNEAYRESNLGPETLPNLDLDVLCVVANSGEAVAALRRNPSGSTDLPAPAALLAHCQPGRPLLTHRHVDRHRAGMLALPEGLCLVASCPVVSSADERPHRGSVVLARFVDGPLLERVSNVSRVSLEVRRCGVTAHPDETGGGPLPPDGTAVRILDGDTIGTHTVVNDLYGRPVAIVQVAAPREIHRQAQATWRNFLLVLLTLGSVAAGLVFLLLHRLVSARLARLVDTIDRIGASGDLSLRLPVEGGDEVATLAAAANQMLATTEETSRELREGQRKLAALLANLPGVVYRCRNDQDWTMEFISDGCTELTGYAPRDFLDHSSVALGQLIHPDDRESVWNRVQAAVRERRSFRAVYRVNDRAGREKWVWEQGQGIFSADGELLALEGFITDITERKVAEDQLRDYAAKVRAANYELEVQKQQLRAQQQDLLFQNERMEELARELGEANVQLTLVSRLDPLTHLLNRRAWHEEADAEHGRANRYGRTYSILMIDVDYFKRFNDTQGHQAGDDCLARVAACIAQICRSSDAVGRYGGEEFVVLVPETDHEESLALAHRIRSGVAGLAIAHPASPVAPCVTVSVGVASRAGDSWEGVVKQADEALYAAKRSGRNRVCSVVTGVGAEPPAG